MLLCCNTLPDNLRDPALPPHTFRAGLKTLLFSSYYQRIRGSATMCYIRLTLTLTLRYAAWQWVFIADVCRQKKRGELFEKEFIARRSVLSSVSHSCYWQHSLTDRTFRICVLLLWCRFVFDTRQLMSKLARHPSPAVCQTLASRINVKIYPGICLISPKFHCGSIISKISMWFLTCIVLCCCCLKMQQFI